MSRIEELTATLDRGAIVARCANSHLNGKYWDDLAVASKPELANSGADSIHEMLDDFQETLPEAVRKDDPWEWEGTPEFARYMQEWAEARFSNVVKELHDLFGEDRNAAVTRCLHVDAAWLENAKETVGTIVEAARFGLFWSAEDGSPDVYFGAKDEDMDRLNVEARIEARVLLDEIDLVNTVLARMDYKNGGDEGEIRLFPHTRILVGDVEDVTPEHGTGPSWTSAPMPTTMTGG